MLPIYALQSGQTAPLPDPAVLSSLSYDQGQPEGGGASIVLLGSGFTAATDVDFGGSSASFTVDNDTQITATLPAHAAGVVDVTVVNAGGSSNALSFEFWSPASLSLTGWWRANYSGSPWAGTASAGASGSNDLTGATAPATGSAVGGFTPADFNGSTHELTADDPIDTVLPDAGYSLVVVLRADTAAADAGASTPYDNPGILCDDTEGRLSAGFSAAGLRVGGFDGSTWDSAVAACPTGTWALGLVVFAGGSLSVSVNGGAADTISRGNTSYNGAALNLVVGKNYGSAFFDGRIAEIVATGADLSANETKLLKYARQRYGEDFAALPEIASISPDLGDIGGGIAVTISGSGFTGATGVEIDGTACTSVVVVDDTTITAVTPAKSAGTYDVVVTHPSGDSGPLSGGFEAWSPASENLTILTYPANYTTSPSGTWARVASAGTSGNSGRDLTEGTNPPTASSGIPNFDGSNDQLLNATAFSTLATAAAGTLLAIFNADALAAAGTNTVDNTGIISDGSGGYIAMTVSASGFGGYIYAGGHKQPTKTSMSTGTWYLGVTRWNGSEVNHALNNAWATPVAAGNVGSVAGTLRVGRNYLSKYFDGKIRMVAIAASALSDATCTKFYVWALGKGYV